MISRIKSTIKSYDFSDLRILQPHLQSQILILLSKIISISTYFPFCLEYEWKNNLRMVRIYFETPTFDRITKDRSAKFGDMLSAIGGTMGLLTGFSLISGIEMMYFIMKIISKFCSNSKSFKN